MTRVHIVALALITAFVIPEWAFAQRGRAKSADAEPSGDKAVARPSSPPEAADRSGESRRAEPARSRDTSSSRERAEPRVEAERSHPSTGVEHAVSRDAASATERTETDGTHDSVDVLPQPAPSTDIYYYDLGSYDDDATGTGPLSASARPVERVSATGSSSTHNVWGYIGGGAMLTSEIMGGSMSAGAIVRVGWFIADITPFDLVLRPKWRTPGDWEQIGNRWACVNENGVVPDNRCNQFVGVQSQNAISASVGFILPNLPVSFGVGHRIDHGTHTWYGSAGLNLPFPTGDVYITRCTFGPSHFSLMLGVGLGVNRTK